MIDYDGKIFHSIANSESGEVNYETIFRYFQTERMLHGSYEGGAIIKGFLVGVVNDKGIIDMRYQHVNDSYRMMTGTCISRPEILEDGRIRLHEEWKWTCPPFTNGNSIIEESLKQIIPSD